MDVTVQLVLAILASSGLWKFLEYLIGAISAKKGKKRNIATHDEVVKLDTEINSIKTELEEKVGAIEVTYTKLDKKLDRFVEHSDELDVKNERDNLRTQMLILMLHYPEDTSQILMLAEKYFVQLHGDWYFTSIFHDYCDKQGIVVPEWANHNSNGGDA